MQNPFAADGIWLRCALHAHTTNSDGEMSPSLLVRHYERAGFDVLVITDHWIRTVEPSTERLLVIPGTELDASMGAPGREAHVLAFGLGVDPIEPGAEFPTLAETVAWIEQEGGIPYLAHPYWSGLHTEEFAGCGGLVGLEVYNAGCELEVGRGLSAVHWDEVLEADGRPWFGIAADDSHHPGFDSSLAWTWMRAADRSQEAVLAALRAGAFYCSTGPVVEELVLEDGTVEVKTSPARSVRLMTGRARGASVNASVGYSYRGEVLESSGEGGITRARFVAPRRAPYGRIEVTDWNGDRAWTNPLWI
jgi:predicted metal-dependent phosphoesterase TrpH